jgi:hypothetical protein
MTGRLILTVAAAGLMTSSIPLPLAFFQIHSLEVREEAEVVMTKLGASCENLAGFCERLREIGRSTPVNIARDEGWLGVQLGSRYFAWEGPGLHALPDLEPSPIPMGLEAALREVGVRPRFGTQQKLHKHLAEGQLQLFETDRHSFRRVVRGAAPQLVLLVKPGSIE